VHPFLARYRKAFDVVMGASARRVRDWEDIIKELHADRGALLGSERFSEMGGVERARALRAVDDEIASAYATIEAILQDRERVLRVPRRFRHRARSIRRKAIQAEDEVTGLKVGDE
jgi:hypothetical protein